MTSQNRWTFAVVADSHFHPPGTPAQAAYASDAVFNARNAAAVALLRRARPELVVHLGDVPHPVPGLADHRRALAVATDSYAELEVPLLVVPGNHDVGDKPHPWAPAPSVSKDKHAVFAEHWGPPWWCLEHRGVLLLGVDTPVLNSGLPLEAEQWAWLEQTLADAAGKPVLAFLHYPPFLLSPDEAEHYDNLAEPARSRLLALFKAHGVRAVFCGHVHHPFWHVHDGAEWVLMPATSFVRPGYAELARVGPGDEHGRNEAQRLGFCLVHVEGEGGDLSLDLEWVWTRGVHSPPALHDALAPGAPRPRCPLGVTLRHEWDAVLDIPADNLDPFRRKRARNDLALLAAWTAGVRLLRLPFEDLRRDCTRRRLADLARHGFRAVVFTAEPLSDADRRLVEQHRWLVAAVEQVLPRERLDLPLPAMSVPLLRAPFRRDQATDGRYFSHFLSHGYALDELPDADGALLRVGSGDTWAVLSAAAALDRELTALVTLPRAGEATAAEDDDAVCRVVGEALLAAWAFPRLQIVLDGFEDHDRGYHPRHGLVDRRGNPRPAWHLLYHLNRLMPACTDVTPTDDGFVLPGVGRLRWGGGAGISLVSGCVGRVDGPVIEPG